MKRDKYWEKKIPLIQSWESISTSQNMEIKEENGYAVIKFHLLVSMV